jgi:hypothetical protein
MISIIKWCYIEVILINPQSSNINKINNHDIKKNIWHMTLEIQVLVGDGHKNVVVLNQ